MGNSHVMGSESFTFNYVSDCLLYLLYCNADNKSSRFSAIFCCVNYNITLESSFLLLDKFIEMCYYVILRIYVSVSLWYGYSISHIFDNVNTILTKIFDIFNICISIQIYVIKIMQHFRLYQR